LTIIVFPRGPSIVKCVCRMLRVQRRRDKRRGIIVAAAAVKNIGDLTRTKQNRTVVTVIFIFECANFVLGGREKYVWSWTETVYWFYRRETTKAQRLVLPWRHSMALMDPEWIVLWLLFGRRGIIANSVVRSHPYLLDRFAGGRPFRPPE